MCFEARQQKILIDDTYEKIDLVFYHRILKCHVLIELKPKKLRREDVVQLGVYTKEKVTAFFKQENEVRKYLRER